MTSTPASTQHRIQRVELCDIVKRFPGVLANNKVCFDVNAGEVHALLGENGAGKSTLMHLPRVRRGNRAAGNLTLVT